MNWISRYSELTKDTIKLKNGLLPIEYNESNSSLLISSLDFKILSNLNSNGPFSQVNLIQFNSNLKGRNDKRGKVGVCKMIDRNWSNKTRNQQSPKIELEILLHALSFPNSPFPRLINSFLTSSHFYLIISHAQGGDLWNILESVNSDLEGENYIGLSEVWVKNWILELVGAIEWLHQEGWAHRDLKPHNLLLDYSGRLLLTDFGSAAPLFSFGEHGKTSIAKKYCQALVGTPDYIAVEVLKSFEAMIAAIILEEDLIDEEDERIRSEKLGEERAYGCESDYWSIGVLTYELLFGQAPFFAESIQETYKRIINAPSSIVFPKDSSVSNDAKSFIKLLLLPPALRLSDSNKIKSNPWFLNDSIPSIPHYRPPTFFIPSTQTTGQEKEFKELSPPNFNFSFFSSPNLSILRPLPTSQATLDHTDFREQIQKQEEDAYWVGMNLQPSRETFEIDEIEEQFYSYEFEVEKDIISELVEKKVEGGVNEKSSLSFETPLRKLSKNHLLNRFTSKTLGEGGSCSSRSKRIISDREAWQEMQELVIEVGRTAKKKKTSFNLYTSGKIVEQEEIKLREKKVEQAGLEGIERKRLKLLDELKGVELKLKELMKIV